MESIDLIIKAGAIIRGKYDPLTAAAENNHLEVVKLLVSLGADVNSDAYAATLPHWQWLPSTAIRRS